MTATEPQVESATVAAGGEQGEAAPSPSPQTRLIPPPPTHRRDRRLVRMAASGTARVDRFNRALFLVVGLVLIAAGVLGVLVWQGQITGVGSPGSRYSTWAADAVASPNLAAAIAMAVCLVLFLLGVRWAVAQLRPVSDGERLGTFRIGSGERGATTVGATSVARAAAADLNGRPGVASAKVRLRAVRPRPRVSVSAELELGADPDTAISELEAGVTRMLATLGTDDGEADGEIRLRFARAARSPGPPQGRVR